MAAIDALVILHSGGETMRIRACLTCVLLGGLSGGIGVGGRDPADASDGAAPLDVRAADTDEAEAAGPADRQISHDALADGGARDAALPDASTDSSRQPDAPLSDAPRPDRGSRDAGPDASLDAASDGGGVGDL